MKSTTFIYTLSDKSGDIRYIGKSDTPRKRLYNHIKESKDLKKKSHKINWIKSLLDKSELPIIEILEEVSIEDWENSEKYWIEQFRQWGFNLTNLTIGGEGGQGYKHTNFAKQKMRVSKSGTKLSEEHRKNISKSLIESYISNPKICDKRIHISKEELYQKYIIENLSMPKLAVFFGCGVKTIFSNLKEFGISKDKEVWSKQMSSNPEKPVLQYDLLGNFIREWDSLTAVEEELKLNCGNISNCCRGVSVTANGFIWRYRDEFIEIDLKKLEYRKRKVSKYDLNGDFVKTFDSIKEAADAGFSDNNIQDCCVGRIKSHGGFIWRYAEDSPPSKYRKKQQRAIEQYTVDGIFLRSWESIIDATKNLGIGGNSITTCCKGKYKSAGGFVWKYKADLAQPTDH